MGIVSLLMVVDQINIAGSVRLFVVAENQPPVSGNSQTPEPLQAAFERMELPAWKPAKLVQRLGGFQGKRSGRAQYVRLGRTSQDRLRLSLGFRTAYYPPA